MKTFFTQLIILGLLLLLSCSKDDNKNGQTDNDNSSVNEFTVDGKTYKIVATQWIILDSGADNTVVSTDEGDGYMFVNLPDTKVGSSKVTKVCSLTYKGLPVYTSEENAVTVTITKNEGGGQTYGGGAIAGTFTGNFWYCDSVKNDMCLSTKTVQISGKFSTTRYY